MKWGWKERLQCLGLSALAVLLVSGLAVVATNIAEALEGMF